LIEKSVSIGKLTDFRYPVGTCLIYYVENGGIVKTEIDVDLTMVNVKINEPHSPEVVIPKKPFHPQRAMKFSSASLVAYVRNMKQNQDTNIFNGYKLRPGAPLFCSWKVPRSLSSKSLSIGLFRYGCQTNDGSLIAKKLESPHGEENDLLVGTIKFFAPKSAGQFIFRLFDHSSKEVLYETLAISTMFCVVLMDNDIVNNLNHVLTAVDENSPHKALGLFQIIIKFVKGNAIDSSEIVKVINQCISEIFKLLNDSMEIVDEGYRRKKQSRELKSNENEEIPEELEKNVEEEEADVEFWKSYRSSVRLHGECYDAFQTLFTYKTCWYWVAEKFKVAISKEVELFCPFLKRFFRDIPSRDFARRENLGFLPTASHTKRNDSLLSSVSKLFEEKAISLIPETEFEQCRIRVKETLQRKLKDSKRLEITQELVVYGSSANGFGNLSSDIDLCLKDLNPAPTSMNRLKIMCKLADALSELGMKDVQPLLTARVPIIEFMEPETGLHCDVAYHNSLALANTAMLRLYGEIDIRVRQMAYLIKHWAKVRNINSPQQGTLGSYGYVLSIIYFLQRRAIPVLPFLQQLHRNEKGIIISESKEQFEKHSIDDISCNIYFFTPTTSELQQFQVITISFSKSFHFAIT
jgi:predicted nucleotidyltransferase